jgi:Bacterial membrane protein YfhO
VWMHLDSSSVFSTRTPASRSVCFAVALALTLLLFGDVIFLGTSLAPLDYDQGVLASLKPIPKPRSVLPEREGRSVLDSQFDIWSGSDEFQPAQRFMAFCLRSGESPYWDPYSATGNLGPEAIIDLKFAPVTLISAMFGGGSAALSFVLVGMVFISAYSILRTFTLYLELSLEAALAACAVFLLNGFAIGNLNLVIGQPYYLAPIVLHAMLLFTDRQTPRNAALAIAATVVIFSTTFTTTVALSLFVVYSITLCRGIAKFPQRKLKLIAIHLAIPSVSLLLLSFMYLPIFDAFNAYLPTLKQYNARLTPGLSLINVLSLFTPKHFWESYAAFRLPTTAPAGPYNKYTFHLGVIAPLIAVHSLSRLKRGTAPIIIAAAAWFSVSVGQMFGIFPFTLIDSLPFFSFITNDYWACMVSWSIVVMVAYGYDALADTNAFTYPFVLLVGVITNSFVFLYGYLGLYGHFETGTDLWTKRYIAIFALILATGSMLIALTRYPRLTKWTKHILLICLIVEGFYYRDGLHPCRSKRDQNPPESIAWLKSAVDRSPGSRVLNIGRYGIFPNWGSALQIPELGLMGFAVAWYESFYHRYIGTDLFVTLGSSPGTAIYTFSDASLSLVGARYIVVDIGNERVITRLSGLGYSIIHQDALRLIFENPHAMARSFAVRDVRTLDGLPSDLGGSTEYSATTTDQTLLSEVRGFGIPVDAPVERVVPEPDLPGAVQVMAYHHDRIRVRSNLKQAALIVLTDSWNPRWSATVDRKPAYIGKVDVAFRGVAVAAGRHDIEFRYYPLSRLFGQVISGATFIGLVVGLWIWEKKPRAEPAPPVVPPPDRPTPAPPVQIAPATSKRASRRRIRK